MRKIIKRIANYISAANKYDTDKEEQVEYALRILIFEALKTLGIIIIFSLLGYTMQAIIAIVAMTIIRPFIGGYHEDTQIKCFIFTFIITGIVIYLSVNLQINLMERLIFNITSLYCIWNQAPIINPKMPLTRDDLLNRNRTIGVFLTFVLVLISILSYKYVVFSNILLWTMLFQSLLMFNKRSIKKTKSPEPQRL